MDVHISSPGYYVHDDKVVNVVKMITDLSFCDFPSKATHDEIPRCSTSNLASYVRQYLVLAIRPTKVELV